MLTRCRILVHARTTCGFLFAVLLQSIIQQHVFVNGTIFLENETFASLPAEFGRTLKRGEIYAARLQFLSENPYLCQHSNKNSSFVQPNNSSDSVALLAVRGNCEFARKAAVAEAIDPSIKFLIVHNYLSEGEDMIVPMGSEFSQSNLYMLSVSHRTGKALRQYALQEIPEGFEEEGGPWIALDDTNPPGMFSPGDLQQLVISAVGLFFLMVSFSGCVLILAGAYGQLQATGHIVLTIPPTVQNLNHRLTPSQIERLMEMSSPTPQAAHDAVAREEAVNDDDNFQSCSICLDETSEQNWVELPCQHRYHVDCIVPWLTERQAKCPLCKFDVLQAILETGHTSGDVVDTDHSSSRNIITFLWTRLTRYRWTRIGQNEQDATEGVLVISPQEMDFEMTDQ